MQGLSPYFSDNGWEAGCDEAGRGCLAGPVFAAAVILPRGFYHPMLNDSKKMTKKQREELRLIIKEEAISWAVAKVFPGTIDKINILNASFKAMHLSLKKLDPQPDHILVDGNRFHRYQKIPHQCVVQGDSIYASIAAASVLAKTYRDDHMEKLHKRHPEYNWKFNKGYPTEEHRLAIREYGPTPHHRLSFRLYPYDKQGSLF